MSKKERIYFDACVYITLINDIKPKRVKNCKGLLQEAEDGKFEILSSTLALAEVAKVNNPQHQSKNDKEKDEVIRGYFDHEYITLVNLGRDIARDARPFIRNHGIKPRDAIHLACAIKGNAATLYTYDKKLLNSNGNVTVIDIEKPKWEGQMEFFN